MKERTVITEQEFRKPNAREKELIRRLLTANFEGKNAIAEQLENAELRIIDDDGSLELRPSNVSPPALVKYRIPVEAEGVDADGVRVHILLHVEKGFVKELEVYKDDGSSIKRMPDPADVDVIAYPIQG